jgi:hypothetical protein
MDPADETDNQLLEIIINDGMNEDVSQATEKNIKIMGRPQLRTLSSDGAESEDVADELLNQPE